MVNGPDQTQVAQLGARGLLVQEHLDSVELIDCSAMCRAVSILPDSRIGHKSHVDCITLSRNTAALGYASRLLGRSTRPMSLGVRGRRVARPERNAPTS